MPSVIGVRNASITLNGTSSIVQYAIALSITIPCVNVQVNDPLVCGAVLNLDEAITADNCTYRGFCSERRSLNYQSDY
ncbi:MAG: hypothetical protein ACERKD_15570 [Prolixibacteraceae bacterium]